jgi:hypothetical protein
MFRYSGTFHPFIVPNSTPNSAYHCRLVDAGGTLQPTASRVSIVHSQLIPMTLLSTNVHIMIDSTETSKGRQVVHYPIICQQPSRMGKVLPNLEAPRLTLPVEDQSPSSITCSSLRANSLTCYILRFYPGEYGSGNIVLSWHGSWPFV